MREKILFDDNWLFHRGDIDLPVPQEKGPIYIQAKTERMRFGPACIQYSANGDDYSTEHEINPAKWESVNLPHDYIIEQTPEEKYNNTLGYFEYGNAWYRKKFTVSPEDKDKRITLLFDGVATHATVYLNGCLMKHNFCGYTSFEVDITDYVEFDTENVLAVYVDSSSSREGWWYQGGGIYRHVWLVKTEKTAVDLWGIYVIPQKTEDGWTVTVENTIRNDFYENKAVSVRTDIVDGDEIVMSLEGTAEISSFSKKTISASGRIEAPQLWSIENPYQYRAVTHVYTDGREADCCETKFGFRYYTYDTENGLRLNGKKIFINGVCAHQDFGLTGKAVPDNILRYKVQLIKEMGANGYRCSHYPHPEATMDALDELGFVVMAETRWFESTDEGMEQLEMLVKRDRNRPSVLFWSVGNEEPKHITESGRRINRKMMERVRQLDNTRIVMSAVSNDPDIATVYDDLDAIGINYNLDKYEKVHAKYPDKMIFSSECCATGTTRSWYFNDNHKKAYLNSIDKDTNEWFRGRENTWKFFKEHEWIVGGYQWIAFEHRGECMWPRLCSQSGAIDLFLQKKDAFYQNQTLWIEDRPLIHLLPHWNFNGFEGEKIRVVAYTNCEEAELFLNGESLGRQKIDKPGHGEWSVEYTSGELRAVGYNNGIAVVEDERRTTGKAYALGLKAENIVTEANGMDIVFVSCYCVDENGLEVPDAAPFVSFTSNTLGEIVGTGSDICDHTPVPMTDRQMREGRISVAVKVGKQSGTLKVYARADGLNSAVLNIDLM